MGVSIVSLNQSVEKIDVIFSDESHDTYDLVVGADGIHSKVREVIYPEDKITYSGYRGWFSWIPKDLVPEETIIEITETTNLCSLFDNPNRACMFLTAKETPGSFCDPETRMKRIKDHFKHFGSPLPEILDQLKAEDFMPTDIGFVGTNKWLKERVVLIGDAAHAMEPFAGIGASIGMEDGYVLADELSQAGSLDINKCLQRYMERRIPRVKVARKQTRMNYLLNISPVPGTNFFKRIFAPLISSAHFTRGYKKLLETEP